MPFFDVREIDRIIDAEGMSGLTLFFELPLIVSKPLRDRLIFQFVKQAAIRIEQFAVQSDGGFHINPIVHSVLVIHLI